MTQNLKATLIMFFSLVLCFIVWLIFDQDTLIFGDNQSTPDEPIEVSSRMLFPGMEE